ncbi:MAG: contractile injection system protein, VgrG/Pvc8 family [Cohaesibacter sp.]|jgi:phage protein D|nr:contractile injection system protein, VgrG/Pvc8 family [Cohaesibacter sp.]
MSQLAEPFVSLIVNGIDVGADFAPHLLDFTWTDNLHGKADEIAAKLRDDQGLWRGPWRPEENDEVEAALGYVGGAVVPCGSYKVDIPEAGGSRGNDSLNFRATSAYPDKDQRTQKSKGSENTNLKKIIEEVAKNLGYTVSGDIEEIPFKYKRQRRERDLAYIKRLAEDYGYFVAIKHKQLVFFKREELEKAAPVRLFELTDPDLLSPWRAKEATSKTYKAAKVSYLDPQSKKLIKGEVQNLSSKSGDVLKIDERVENEDQAKKLAKGRLAKANENKRTASLKLVGNPGMVAGLIIELGVSFGKYAGKYLIHKAAHAVKRGNYTTKLELKGV